jgi:hypothetical protein
MYFAQTLGGFPLPTNPESFRDCSTTELPWREGKKLNPIA